MARGPLPTGQAARSKYVAPVHSGTTLPAEGRSAPIPESPLPLGDRGQRWWDDNWSTPEAAGWPPGVLWFVAHRAQLEDDMQALVAEDFDILDDVLSFPDQDAAQLIKGLINTLKALATNKVSLQGRMNDMDKQLGLTPKAFADLRWRIDEPKGESKGADLVSLPPPEFDDAG
jgi:hypothetical protein